MQNKREKEHLYKRETNPHTNPQATIGGSGAAAHPPGQRPGNLTTQNQRLPAQSRFVYENLIHSDNPCHTTYNQTTSSCNNHPIFQYPKRSPQQEATRSPRFNIDVFYDEANKICKDNQSEDVIKRTRATKLIAQLNIALMSKQFIDTLSLKNIANIFDAEGKFAVNDLLLSDKQCWFVEALLQRAHNVMTQTDRPTEHITHIVYGLGLMAKENYLSPEHHLQFDGLIECMLVDIERNRSTRQGINMIKQHIHMTKTSLQEMLRVNVIHQNAYHDYDARLEQMLSSIAVNSENLVDGTYTTRQEFIGGMGAEAAIPRQLQDILLTTNPVAHPPPMQPCIILSSVAPVTVIQLCVVHEIQENNDGNPIHYQPPPPYDNHSMFQHQAASAQQKTTQRPYLNIDSFYAKSEIICRDKSKLANRRCRATILMRQLNESLNCPQFVETLSIKNIADIISAMGQLATYNLLFADQCIHVNVLYRCAQNISNHDEETVQIISKIVFGLGLMARAQCLAQESVECDAFILRMQEAISFSDGPAQHISVMVYGLGLLAQANCLAKNEFQLDGLIEVMQENMTQDVRPEQTIASTVHGLQLMAVSNFITQQAVNHCVARLNEAVTIRLSPTSRGLSAGSSDDVGFLHSVERPEQLHETFREDPPNEDTEDDLLIQNALNAFRGAPHNSSRMHHPHKRL